MIKLKKRDVSWSKWSKSTWLVKIRSKSVITIEKLKKLKDKPISK